MKQLVLFSISKNLQLETALYTLETRATMLHDFLFH